MASGETAPASKLASPNDARRRASQSSRRSPKRARSPMGGAPIDERKPSTSDSPSDESMLARSSRDTDALTQRSSAARLSVAALSSERRLRTALAKAPT